MRREAVADRAKHAHDIACLACRERMQARAGNLVKHLDPSSLRVNAHQRQRPPHRHRRIARDMRKATGLRVRRALWRLDADHILTTVERSVFEKPPFFEKDRTAMLVTH